MQGMPHSVARHAHSNACAPCPPCAKESTDAAGLLPRPAVLSGTASKASSRSTIGKYSLANEGGAGGRGGSRLCEAAGRLN